MSARKVKASNNTAKLTISLRSPKTGNIIGYANILDSKAAEMLGLNLELLKQCKLEIFVKAEGSSESPF